LLRGKEKMTQRGGIKTKEPKNEKILAPLQWDIPPFHNS